MKRQRLRLGALACLLAALGCADRPPAALPVEARAESGSPPREGSGETNILGMRLVRIPAGEFEMGFSHSGQFEELAAAFPHSILPKGDELFAADESPRHLVRLTRPFFLSSREVTVGQFRQFVQAVGHRTTAERTGEGVIGFAPPSAEEYRKTARQRPFQRRPEFTWKAPGFAQDDNHPVVGVSWEDAHAFCAWLSKHEGATYRLPTEAEWEYACRAGTTIWFSFGDRARDTIHRLANAGNVELEKAQPGSVMRQWLVDEQAGQSDGHVYTAPAGSYLPNPWGVHDLHGNVWEWCQDRYLEQAYRKRAGKGPFVDPLTEERTDGPGDWRVIRGGSWYNAPIMCRSSSRGFFDGTDAACYVGFRVVREVTKDRPAR